MRPVLRMCGRHGISLGSSRQNGEVEGASMRVLASGMIGRIAALAVLACAVLGLSASAAFAEESEQFKTERLAAQNLGVQAYIYGQPLLDSQRIYQTITGVTKPDTQGDAPVNQFSHLQTLSTTKEGCVVAPNADTLYSIAELKLKPHPIVIHVPATEPERLNVVEMLSPYTENFATIGSQTSGLVPPGDYAIAGPGRFSATEEIDGLKVIHSPYNQVWLIARTVVKNPADLATARAIQAEEKLVPLNKWNSQGLGYEAPTSEEKTTTTCAHIPGTVLGENQLLYWKALGKELKLFPPPAADKPILESLAAVHIGPGMHPTKGNVSPATLQGLREAVTLGPGQVLQDVKANIEASFLPHNGWLVAGLGNYGTNYVQRVETDRLGVGAPTPNLSIYPLALTDRNGVKLTGLGSRYVVHFPAGDFPVPVQAFWSLTLYESNGFFVANPLERYTLGDRSNLHFNGDGSMDIYVQTTEPSTEAQRDNWLPAPAGGFQMIMRLYGVPAATIPGILEGGPGNWQPPTILPCLESGKTATGWDCAS